MTAPYLLLVPLLPYDKFAQNSSGASGILCIEDDRINRHT